MNNITHAPKTRIENITDFIMACLKVALPSTALFCAVFWALVDMAISMIGDVPFLVYMLCWLLTVYWSTKYLIKEFLWLARLAGTLDGVSDWNGTDKIKIADGMFIQRKPSAIKPPID